jgi:predicted metal-dependent RNase
VAALPKGKNPWVTVTFLGSHSGVSFASCFAAHLWETLKDSVGLECKFRIAERDKDSTHYINIVDILAVDGQPIQLGEGQ